MMNMTGGGRVGKPITYFVRGDFYDDDDDANDDDDKDKSETRQWQQQQQ